MKKLNVTILIIGLFSFSLFSYAQKNPDWDYHIEDNPPKTFLGFGTGINNFVGIIGIQAETQIGNKFSVGGGAGIGGWGYKVSTGLRFYNQYPFGVAFGLGASVAAGIREISLPMEFGDVLMKLEAAPTVNATVSYHFKLGRKKRNRFSLEGGYSIPIKPSPYQVLDGSALSNTDLAVMKIMRPGGIILSFMFTFAL